MAESPPAAEFCPTARQGYKDPPPPDQDGPQPAGAIAVIGERAPRFLQARTAQPEPLDDSRLEIIARTLEDQPAT